MVFTPILLTCSVLLNNGVEMFIYFSKHMGYLGIYPGLTCLEYSFGKLGEDELFFRRVHDTGVCHGPVPVVYIELSLKINTYLLKGTCFGGVDSLDHYNIASVIVLYVLHTDVLKY